MAEFARSRRLTDGTASRIVELLRHGPMTIDDLAEALGLTRTAVRAQLTVLLGDGAVEHRGFRKGLSKPARLFAVTAEAEQQLSRAYVPILAQLLQVLSQRMGPDEFDRLMHEVGRGLGPTQPAQGTVRERVEMANALLRDLGALTSVAEENGRLIIQGHGCPLAAATAEFPQACSVITSLLTEVIGRPVTNCCEDSGRKRCCFTVSLSAA